MNIVRLSYVSRLSRDTGPDALGKIMETSRRNNKPLGITGALCYSPRGFLQILEGPAGPVNELFRRIVQDKRHSNVTLLEYVHIPFRDFENWSMAYIRADEITRSLLRKFSTRRIFDPFEMGPVQARGFLMAVAQERQDFLAKQQNAIRQRRN
ncbi:MAG TPA: BLUF domain-containing protein [Kiritimatiellia bacterium]|nr:BLUF domain-containing protein [Kiritimatiellia bacterium]